MSKFFNSLWFRCISVLLVISVVLGGILAIANDVLNVTPEERRSRAIKKIYEVEIPDEDIKTLIDVDVVEYNKPEDYGSMGKITKLYIVGNEESGKFDYLFQTTGGEGYKGGTITLWVQVNVDNGNMSIGKIIQESYEKQTLMSKITDAFYNNFKDPIDGRTYVSKNAIEGQEANIVSGATFSAQAGCNAINCVVKYVQENLRGAK